MRTRREIVATCACTRAHRPAGGGRMKALFVHQNSPGQFKHLAPRLAACHRTGWTSSRRTPCRSPPGCAGIATRPRARSRPACIPTSRRARRRSSTGRPSLGSRFGSGSRATGRTSSWATTAGARRCFSRTSGPKFPSSSSPSSTTAGRGPTSASTRSSTGASTPSCGRGRGRGFTFWRWKPQTRPMPRRTGRNRPSRPPTTTGSRSSTTGWTWTGCAPIPQRDSPCRTGAF
jgi:hypothetical protein